MIVTWPDDRKSTAGSPIASSPAARGCDRRRRQLRRAAAALAVALALISALAAASASAAAPYVDGISDQNLGLWDGNYLDTTGLFGPPFTSLFANAWVGPSGSHHLQYARFVTAPDAVAQGGACEQNLTTWFTYVTQTLHLIPVIAVWDVAEGGCADHGAPSASAYATDVQQLVTYLDGLHPGTTIPYIEAWNEPNSSGVPAATAAGYWTAANTVCATAGCTAIAGDFVDNDPDQGSPSFNPGCPAGLTYNVHLATYEQQYVTALGTARPTIWGFHPYYAVNCEQSTSVTTFESGLPSPAGQIWFTEVAAWECVNGQSTPRGVSQQNADAEYLVNTLMSPTFAGAPAHVFYYEMAAPQYTLDCAKYADSELYEAATDPGPLLARPAAATIYGPDTSLAATTGPPSGVTSTQATFTGTLTPGGIYEASYYFQYGPTTAYGSQTTPLAVGPGLEPQQINATVSGLAPATAYHYQLVVTDTNGLTVDGADELMAPVLLSTSAATIVAGQPLTVSWSGVSNPTAGDWIGLYQPGAPAGAYADYFYAGSCAHAPGAAAAASGSCTYTVPDDPGTYELRLLAGPAAGLLTSSAQITILPPPPVNTAAPAISGESDHQSAYPGDVLSCSSGSWSSSPTAYAYQWTIDGTPLAGATAQSYVVTGDELGEALSCSVTASNAGGSGAPAPSAAVAVVSPKPRSSAPPAITGSAAPSISGRATVGERLSEIHGSWSNAPTGFSYQWQRCDRAGGDCRAIAGATGRTYTLSAADIGSRIRVLETASNARARGTPMASRVTAVVEPPAPNTLLSAVSIASTAASASFHVRASGAASGFRCALVREPTRRGAQALAPVYGACAAAVSFSHLQPGSYAFYARAVGPGGPDPTPVVYRFVIS